MPKVSVNILTKNRLEFLKVALDSVFKQSFQDFEIVVVNDGSTDSSLEYLLSLKDKRIKIISHQVSKGIIFSRQECLEKSVGEYIAILDDDDSWLDVEKLKKQVEFLETHKDYLLVGGGIEQNFNSKSKKKLLFRPESDFKIRQTMLFQNNFFTSTVMFKRQEALVAGGFVKDIVDLCEDYDLWLRLGKLGKMYNFLEVFASYTRNPYNVVKYKKFLQKQFSLIGQQKYKYPNYFFAKFLLSFRLFLLSLVK